MSMNRVSAFTRRHGRYNPVTIFLVICRMPCVSTLLNHTYSHEWHDTPTISILLLRGKPGRSVDRIRTIHTGGINRQGTSAGIRSNKKRHINCASSARIADIMGVNEDQVRRQSRGINTTMKGRSHQPSKRNGAITGRLPLQGRSFFLARAALVPPTSLYKRLFPAIDEWHDRIAAKELRPDNNNPIQPTVTSNAFV
ncbi:hypothetical protein [Absidia glauca]|uniref:Ndc10 domain-containing protein n=1 Tax=Absidia glauca TaxID=4829 RepID=A0A168RRR7_ABSGL|nr:hypothetical protein [Absidia glauca]